jgi:purine-nucleoside phosphorylase
VEHRLIEQSRLAAEIVRHHTRTLWQSDQTPRVGIVLGSGLGRPAQQLLADQGVAVDYSLIPGMPPSRVAGHRGQVVCGMRQQRPVVMLQGRVHAYEGHDDEALTAGVRLLFSLGVQQLILTNAAGGVRDGFHPGDLMLLDSHLEFPRSTRVPLTCAGSDQQPPDTPAGIYRRGVNPWDAELLKRVRSVPTSLNIHQGTYALMPGPNYETAAEVRMLKALGADAVGMSTVPEARWAAVAGMRVLAVSCITNAAAGLTDQRLDHAEVSQTARSVETEFSDWLFRAIDCISTPQGSR